MHGHITTLAVAVHEGILRPSILVRAHAAAPHHFLGLGFLRLHVSTPFSLNPPTILSSKGKALKLALLVGGVLLC